MGATGREIVEQAEARLAPLLEDANVGWWDSQVEATEANAAKRERAELAWSNALADREQFAAVRSARETGAGGDVGRRLDLLYDATLRHQVPDRLRERIVELETSIDLRFSRHRGVVAGSEVGDTEIKKILRRSDHPTGAPRGMGGVEDRRRRRGRRRARGRASAQRGRAVAGA